MLSLLLDENVSPKVARQIAEKRAEILVIGISQWHDGRFMAAPDTTILAAAADEGLMLVTYDQKTIAPILARWSQSGTDHGGVLFADHRTIRSDDFSTLVRSLIVLWDAAHADDWTDRVDFLQPAR